MIYVEEPNQLEDHKCENEITDDPRCNNDLNKSDNIQEKITKLQ